jgi:acyl-CoA synthetase (AMP-forming)/AMP-acid ligase II
MPSPPTNVADRLAAAARQSPDAVAVAQAGRIGYATCSFRELADDATALARGLIDVGVKPSDRLVLLIRPGIEFVKLVFALLRTGAVAVLVDPGMGLKNLVNCLAAAEPDGFIAVSRAQAVRTLMGRRYPRARHNVTLGRRWFWGGVTYRQLLRRGHFSQAELPTTHADHPAAIIFTSGSTGPPKGVLYTHQMFDSQASEIQRAYDLKPGGVDLACFALFGLFNSAMGVTTVFPEMDFSRPASADPHKLLTAANDWYVTQAFASPAVWDKLSRHCETSGERIPTLRKIFSCGAPVPATVLQRTLAMVHPEAEMHTPYGATEALPVATIEAREVLGETAEKTNQGAGVCVGRKFDTIQWRVIRIRDVPIAMIADAEELPPNEIGELIVRGPQVSNLYLPASSPSVERAGERGEAGTRFNHSSLTRPDKGSGPEDANTLAKIRDGDAVWHRMGDVGYLDDQKRFWYCGRKSQRVETSGGTLFTERVEAIFNQHPAVRRSALIGLKEGGRCTPILVVEINPEIDPQSVPLVNVLLQLGTIAKSFPMTREIKTFLPHKSLPTDVRHNSKINREALAAWAEATSYDINRR